MDYILEARHIDKHFTDPTPFHVLKDIHFGIETGEFVSIMGKSGCGKSTLLYILSTMDTQYQGELWLNHELITGKPHEYLARLRNQYIGFVFQFHYLLNDFSVLENVMLPSRKLGLKSDAEIRKEAYERLEILGVAQTAHKKASKISGGEKQRVAIARALINSPKLLMGDEPTGNLDSHNSAIVMDIFRTLRDQYGLSLLIVTHDQDFADRTDRIIHMEDGRIL